MVLSGQFEKMVFRGTQSKGRYRRNDMIPHDSTRLCCVDDFGLLSSPGVVPILNDLVHELQRVNQSWPGPVEQS